MGRLAEMGQGGCRVVQPQGGKAGPQQRIGILGPGNEDRKKGSPSFEVPARMEQGEGRVRGWNRPRLAPCLPGGQGLGKCRRTKNHLRGQE